jgi:hypothetical protein
VVSRVRSLPFSLKNPDRFVVNRHRTSDHALLSFLCCLAPALPLARQAASGHRSVDNHIGRHMQVMMPCLEGYRWRTPAGPFDHG